MYKIICLVLVIVCMAGTIVFPQENLEQKIVAKVNDIAITLDELDKSIEKGIYFQGWQMYKMYTTAEPQKKTKRV